MEVLDILNKAKWISDVERERWGFGAPFDAAVVVIEFESDEIYEAITCLDSVWWCKRLN